MRAFSPATVLRLGVLAVILALASCRAATSRTIATPIAAIASSSAASPTLRFKVPPLGPEAPPAPPMRLTSSDGRGLRLAKLTARVVVDDPLAFTEITLVFENPEPRVIEGTFAIALAEGASVSRFAMKIGGALQEGEMVEREAARVAYEDFLHRKQDPALLEQGAGNEFTARVFPIPAGGTKEIVLSYSQELTGDVGYALPLLGMPEIGELDVVATIAGDATPHAMKETKIVPSSDFAVPLRTRRDGIRSDDLVAVRVRPVVESRPEPIASLAILVDTSASRALGFDAQARLVERVVQAIARAGSVALSVACFDQSTEIVFRGEASSFGAADVARIRDRQAFGASDLTQALAWAAREGRKRVLLIGDGVATAGEIAPEKLAASARKLGACGVERVDAIGVGGIRDSASLRSIVTAGLLHDGVVLDGASDVGIVARRLGEATRSSIAIDVEGATWTWPRRLDGVQAGDEALVYASVPAERPVRVAIDGAAAKTMNLARVDRPLLARAWASAKIASLTSAQATASDAGAIAREIVTLSIMHRVLSPYTALLVLESEADYARYRIDRRALTDILTVDRGRVAVTKRASTKIVGDASAPPPAPATRGLVRPTVAPSPVANGATHRVRPPMVRAGSTSVQGRVPPQIIQRVIRQQLGTMRACYESGLRRNPTLRGRVVVRFVIDRTGAVAAAADGGSELADPDVVACVVQAFRAFVFPAPDGVVSVVYPLVFAPNDPSCKGDDCSGPPPASLDPRRTAPRIPEPSVPPTPPPMVEPYVGRFKTIMDTIARGDRAHAIQDAFDWHTESPGDLMALVALGESLEAANDQATAARVYGSIVDLFSSRADLRRFAGERLERVRTERALDLAIDTYAKALDDRSDHPSSHRLLAFALVKRREHARAFETLARAIAKSFDSSRFLGVARILREDLGLVAAAWIKAEPSREPDIRARLDAAGGHLEDRASLRFVLNWETDANDVDFHITDDHDNHAFFEHPTLPDRGGELYADVTQGYGPECFTIARPRSERASTYTLKANYYARGPMGFGMGKVQIIEHDGAGGLSFDERPFVVMADRAFVDLGSVKGAL